MGHAGDVDFHHQVVGQIGVDVGPVGTGDEAVRLGEIRIEEIERGPASHNQGIVSITHTPGFPPADIAAIGRGFGFEGVTVRDPADLAPVRDWLAGPRERPLLIDAKVTSAHGSWWLEEAFRGH